MLGDLHQSNRISSNFSEKIKSISHKHEKANFFDIPKSFILIELPFCSNSKIKSKHFLKKFYRFTKDRFEVAIKWKTRQVKTLFPLQNKSIHPSCDLLRYLFMW